MFLLFVWLFELVANLFQIMLQFWNITFDSDDKQKGQEEKSFPPTPNA